MFQRSHASIGALAAVLTLLLVRLLSWPHVPSLLVFIFVFVTVRLVQYFLNLSHLPPGPWGLPIIGYLPFLRADAHLHFEEMTRKYGSLFSTKLGNQLIVVMSDYKSIRDAFRREEFSGRPHTEFSTILGGYGECLFHFQKRVGS